MFIKNILNIICIQIEKSRIKKEFNFFSNLIPQKYANILFYFFLSKSSESYSNIFNDKIIYIVFYIWIEYFKQFL